MVGVILFDLRSLYHVGMIYTLEIIQYAEPKHRAKSNNKNSSILSCAAYKQYTQD